MSLFPSLQLNCLRIQSRSDYQTCTVFRSDSIIIYLVSIYRIHKVFIKKGGQIHEASSLDQIKMTKFRLDFDPKSFHRRTLTIKIAPWWTTPSLVFSLTIKIARLPYDLSLRLLMFFNWLSTNIGKYAWRWRDLIGHSLSYVAWM